MPTKLKNRDGNWLARVVINGKEVDSKIFPKGRKKGPEWTAAKNWEEQRKTEILKNMTKPKTPSDLELLLDWGEKYLIFAERTMGHSTFIEKKTVMQAFFKYCHAEGVTAIGKISKPFLMQWLLDIADERGPARANRYRKNLLSAWHWGIESIDGFPQEQPLIERIKPFPVDENERYVPPEEDVIKVLQQAHGQDLVMLLTYYYTGARRSEVFRLTWPDIDLENGKIRLVDHKAGAGKQRVRWLAMHPELVKALTWWEKSRPCRVENVFMQLQNDAALGKPFKHRNKLMPILCERAGVKPFGFHALRHKAASIAFAAGGLNAAQTLMGHNRATTTDRYVRSAGLYSKQDVITDALGQNGIGQAAEELLEKEMPHGGQSHEAFCKQATVNNVVKNL